MLALAAALALLAAAPGAAGAQPGCKVYKTFVPATASSVIVVPDSFQVGAVIAA